MKKVFLETHNVKNRTSGFGVFNYELIKAFAKINPSDLELILNLKNISTIKKQFGNTFCYNRYTSLQRQSWWGVLGDYDVWHSMNQNIKVEPIRCPKKYILTVHDVNFAEDLSQKKNKESYKVFQMKLNRADEITYISDYAKQQTYKFFKVPQVKEKVIYNGNPINEFLDVSSYKPGVPVDKPYFYSLGDFIPKKKFEALLRMMKEISDFNLIISGSNQKPYGDFIRSQIKELKLETKVFLTGKVSEQGKQYYLKNCVAFLFPSVAEGFGFPPIEAMRFGKPVFLSNLASLPEIGGEVSFYWESFEANYMKEVLFKRLDEYENNKDLYIRKLKERADFFNWEKSAKNYLDSYKH